MTPCFAADSFWNTPIPADAALHPQSERWCGLLAQRCGGAGVHINLHAWTIPVVEAEAGTPMVRVERRIQRWSETTGFIAASRHRLREPGHPLGHAPGFAGAPIPAHARPDPAMDGHLLVVDRAAGMAYDMWAAERGADGGWSACTGISYPIAGSGVFDRATVAVGEGESVHLYGPGRASGVPLLAGLIRHHEVLAGRIAHRLAFATDCSAWRRHAFPALWTDGWLPGGIPQGSVLQLDPGLDLRAFALGPAELTVARALQEFGAVLVDVATGCTLYGEGLWHRAGAGWRGLLDEDGLRRIPFTAWRVLALHPERDGGLNPLYHNGHRPWFRRALAATGTPAPACDWTPEHDGEPAGLDHATTWLTHER